MVAGKGAFMGPTVPVMNGMDAGTRQPKAKRSITQKIGGTQGIAEGAAENFHGENASRDGGTSL